MAYAGLFDRGLPRQKRISNTGGWRRQQRSGINPRHSESGKSKRGKIPTGANAMKVTSKGQVTIPQGIRQKLGLHPNTEVYFEIAGNSAQIKKVRGAAGRGERLIAHLKGRGTVRMTTDEILALTRK